MKVAKGDVVEASGSLQLYAGQKAGSEAAIHAMNSVRKSAYTRGGFWTLNTELSHLLFSRQRVVWGRNACNTIAD